MFCRSDFAPVLLDFDPHLSAHGKSRKRLDESVASFTLHVMNGPAPFAVALDPGEELDDTAELAQIEHVLAEFRHLDIGRAAGTWPPLGEAPVRVGSPALAGHER